MTNRPRPLGRSTTAAMLPILLAATACTTNSQTGGTISKLGESAPAGQPAGGLIGGHQGRTQMIVGAGIGAIARPPIRAYMDRLGPDMPAQPPPPPPHL